MNVSIIIPNLNGENLLKKNLSLVLDAARKYKKGKVEIIIADDPSVDKSESVIDEFIRGINDENIVGKSISNKNKKEAGFSKNVNRAVSISSGEILILLNSDVAPRKDFLEPLLDHFRDDQVFAVGCMDESVEGEKKVLRGRGIGSFKRGFLIHAKGDVEKNNTLWVSGGSGAFRKRIWDKLKGFDQLYNPFYWEDIDLSYRALKSGYKVFFEPKSIVIHDHEQGAVKKGFRDEHIKEIAYRNQFIFMWKNITDKNLIALHVLWLPYHFASALFRLDWAFFSGFFQAIILFDKIIKSRKSAQKNFNQKDKDIIRNYV